VEEDKNRTRRLKLQNLCTRSARDTLFHCVQGNGYLRCSPLGPAARRRHFFRVFQVLFSFIFILFFRNSSHCLGRSHKKCEKSLVNTFLSAPAEFLQRTIVVLKVRNILIFLGA